MAIKLSGQPFSLEIVSLGFLNGFLLACTNGISNIMNQIHDREVDKLMPHKRNRPIPSGAINIDEALSIVAVLMIVTLGLAWFFFPPFYGMAISIILVFTWMYNSPPLRLKNKLFWSNFAIATPRGALGIIAAYSAFANPFDTRILIPALALGIYVYGANTFKDYEDCEVDKKMGVRNFCTVYGKKKVSLIVLPFLYLPFPIFVLSGSYTVLLALPLSIVMTIILRRNPSLKDCGILMWRIFYLQFALIMLLYALPFLL
jgi:4-hydroxybenzoate polyprenyltransferase